MFPSSAEEAKGGHGDGEGYEYDAAGGGGDDGRLREGTGVWDNDVGASWIASTDSVDVIFEPGGQEFKVAKFVRWPIVTVACLVSTRDAYGKIFMIGT